ncbi:hypothetical protein [Candidatus Venteria ishoeyi]|nr:hypothetical protein [Candidatus Venteria ishoeyi]MDM8545176.1 hypothetical protein [Candidatus Venteria ishoeyi]
MKKTAATGKERHARYRERKDADNKKQFNCWLAQDDIKQLEAIAKDRGWVNVSGRGAGKPNMQKAIEAVISAGIEILKNKPVSTNK